MREINPYSFEPILDHGLLEIRPSVGNFLRLIRVRWALISVTVRDARALRMNKTLDQYFLSRH